jgi:hypothetical protein
MMGRGEGGMILGRITAYICYYSLNLGHFRPVHEVLDAVHERFPFSQFLAVYAQSLAFALELHAQGLL